MDPAQGPNLKLLHAESTLNRVKLELFRRLTTDDLKSSLAPGQHQLPREIMKASDESFGYVALGAADSPWPLAPVVATGLRTRPAVGAKPAWMLSFRCLKRKRPLNWN
jgi:hypothetical protein